jgi:hypothetical protein
MPSGLARPWAIRTSPATLNPAAGEAPQGLILIASTGGTQVYQELDDRVLGNAGHATRGANAVAFD